MPHETTEITEKIKAYGAGEITRDQLLQYLTEDVRYAKPQEDKYEVGEPERYYWVEGGTPYTPGSFDEVTLANNTGWLPDDVYEAILHIFHDRS